MTISGEKIVDNYDIKVPHTLQHPYDRQPGTFNAKILFKSQVFNVQDCGVIFDRQWIPLRVLFKTSHRVSRFMEENCEGGKAGKFRRAVFVGGLVGSSDEPAIKLLHSIDPTFEQLNMPEILANLDYLWERVDCRLIRRGAIDLSQDPTNLVLQNAAKEINKTILESRRE